MGTRELRETYGKKSGSAREAINRAIRAELPGGNEALDALTLFHEMKHRLDATGENRQAADICQVAMERVAGIAAAMEREIRKRYGMKSD